MKNLIVMGVCVFVVLWAAKNRLRPSTGAIRTKILHLLGNRGEMSLNQLEQEFKKGFVRADKNDILFVLCKSARVNGGVVEKHDVELAQEQFVRTYYIDYTAFEPMPKVHARVLRWTE